MKKALKILIVVLLVAAAAAAGFFFGRGGKAPPPQAAAPAAEAKAPEGQPAAGDQSVAAKKAPAPPRVIEPVRPANWPAFSIELANFRDTASAAAYAAEMRRRELAVEVVETVDEGGRSWYHVRWGRFVDPRQAAARLPDVQRTAGVYGIVTAELPAGQATAGPAAVPAAAAQ